MKRRRLVSVGVLDCRALPSHKSFDSRNKRTCHEDKLEAGLGSDTPRSTDFVVFTVISSVSNVSDVFPYCHELLGNRFGPSETFELRVDPGRSGYVHTRLTGEPNEVGLDSVAGLDYCAAWVIT